MENQSCCQNWKKGVHDFNFDSPKTRQLLKRFEAMSKKDRSELINSICPNKGTMEEASETFESILQFLKNNGGDSFRSICDKLQTESEDYEEEEEEDEDSENEAEVCNNCDKRKLAFLDTHFSLNPYWFFFTMCIIKAYLPAHV